MAFCGVGPVPKGKRRGTIEQCLDAKQIRYYGLHKVDKKTLAKTKKKSNKQREQIKYQKLVLEAKELIRKFGDAKAIIAHPERYTKRQVTKAMNEKARILSKKDKLKKRIQIQKIVVENL